MHRANLILKRHNLDNGVCKGIVAATVIHDISLLLDLTAMTEAGISAFYTSLIVVSQNRDIISAMKRTELPIAFLVVILKVQKGNGKEKSLYTDRHEAASF